jgi:hypothetical protein
MKIEIYVAKATEVGKSKNGYVPSPAPVMNNLETKGFVPTPAPAAVQPTPAQSTKK